MESIDKKAADILERLKVLRTGHFSLTSGLHSDRYMQCAKLFENPLESEELCSDLSKRFSDIDLVAGPAVGGIIMAYEVARALGVRNIFAEREGGKMTLRREFSVSQGERVLIVEDVVTTGGSVKEVIDLLRESGAEIAGVGAIVDRSGGRVSFGVPFHALITTDVSSWKEEECPLCRDGVPLSKPGSRAV
ncbi:MAG: orotate phosphoribosyltransferase [Synergistaceae bacterium]|jgi:orotate phosphoribosyltransferase|nr:orotate phosphoribosyltransferase [Synergistaceae bacterium]